MLQSPYVNNFFAYSQIVIKFTQVIYVLFNTKSK